jgi:leucyl-tRNA synthetase
LTQFIFLKLFEKGLAYKKKANVNWCPKDQTVLANEQVVSGKCERCGTEVVQKDLEQWFFKITDYAERLLVDLENLKWSEPIKEAQRNWIGKSEGAEISFELRAKNLESGKLEAPSSQLSAIKVFTTRADTLLGVTYLVLAPEHTEIENLKSKIENWSEVEKYLNEVKKITFENKYYRRDIGQKSITAS